ncbi:MAG: transcription antitermination factor NusB [Rhodobacterales bacterium]|nr:transcription antitermination factor NusB [Rhodobacterales bacterium]
MTKPRKPGKSRTVARLAAVQAAYEMEVAGAPADPVLRAFVTQRWNLVETAKAVEEEEGERPDLQEPDSGLMTSLVRAMVDRRDDLDAMINGALAEGWTTERLELLLLIILRAGACEMLTEPQVPAKVIISEYVDIARSFFSEGEPKMVNGVLDRLARTLRPGDLAPREAPAG